METNERKMKKKEKKKICIKRFKKLYQRTHHTSWVFETLLPKVNLEKWYGNSLPAAHGYLKTQNRIKYNKIK